MRFPRFSLAPMGLLALLFCLLVGLIHAARPAHAATVVVTFDNIPAVELSPGQVPPMNTRYCEQALASHGVRVWAAAGYGVVNRLGSGNAYSGENGLISSTKLARQTRDAAYPIVLNFFSPLDTTAPAVTDFVSVRGDLQASATEVKLEAFDLQGNLLASDTQVADSGVLLQVATPGIHRVHLVGNGETTFDDLTFNSPVIPNPRPRSIWRINFEGNHGFLHMMTGSYVPTGCRLTDKYLSSHGVRFSSTGGFATFTYHDSMFSSGDIALGGSNAAEQLSHKAQDFIRVSFFDRANPSAKAVTDYVFIHADMDPNGAIGPITMKAYDLADTLIGTTSAADDGGGLLSLSVPGIHRVEIIGSSAANFDDLTFHAPSSVSDTIPPVLSNPSADPAVLPSNGGNTLLSVRAQDATGVASVLAELTDPDGVKSTITLSRVSGTAQDGVWRANFTAPFNVEYGARVYSIRFTAVDGLDNRGYSALTSLTVEGTGEAIPPTLSAPTVTPESLPGTGGTVTLRVAASDNAGVIRTVARVARPDGTSVEVDLARSSGTAQSGVWDASFTVPPNPSFQEDQTYSVTFRAVDISGNQSTDAGPVTFSVLPFIDIAAPVLSFPGAMPNPLPSAGGISLLRVTVTDNQAVHSAMARVTRPDGSKLDAPLTLVSGDVRSGVWQVAFEAPANPLQTAQNYSVVFYATDLAGLQGGPAGPVTLTVSAPQETVPPTLSNLSANPASLPRTGGFSTLSVTAADNVGVTAVTAEVTRPSGQVESVTLTRSSGTGQSGVWQATFSAPVNTAVFPANYAVRFQAVDAVGNVSAAHAPLTLAVAPALDQTPPTLSQPETTPTIVAAAGGSVTLSVTAADNHSVATATARVTRPGGSVVTVALSRVFGTEQDGRWQGTWAAPANTLLVDQTYSVTFVATDPSGNQGAATAPITFKVASAPDSVPPVVSDPTVSPSLLPRAGGPVALGVRATDNTGAVAVRAEVTRPDGSKSSVALSLVSGDGKLGQWSGSFTAGANTAAGAQLYQVVYYALDAAGNESSASSSLTVRVAGLVKVRGRVTVGGKGQPGITVTGGGVLATTNSAGEYLLDGVPEGSQVIEPFRPGYVFTPASRTVNLTGDLSNVDFTAVTPITLSVNPVKFKGGAKITLKAVLKDIPRTNVTVALSSSHPNVVPMPGGGMLIKKNKPSGTVEVKTRAVKANTVVTLTATYNGASYSTTVTVTKR